MHSSPSLFLLFQILPCVFVASRVKLPLRRYKNTRKYDAPAQRNALGHEELRDFKDFLYVTQISLGTPAQEFRVVLDTGSSDFWLPGRDCCRGMADDKLKKFDSGASSSYQPSGAQFRIDYGDGSFAAGPLGMDTVRFGTEEEDLLTVPDSSVGVGTQFDKDTVADGRFDGILGLGLSNSSSNTEPVLVSAARRGLLAESIFTFYLKTDWDRDEDEHGGEFTFGQKDEENCGPLIGWVDLTMSPLAVDYDFWQFPVEMASHAGLRVQQQQLEAISDTGTSTIMGWPELVGPIVEAIGQIVPSETNPGYLDIPCEHNYEPIILQIGGMPFELGKEVLTMAPVDGQGRMCSFGLAFQAHDETNPRAAWLLGDPFIRKYCNVYDIGRKRIGFARAKRM